MGRVSLKRIDGMVNALTQEGARELISPVEDWTMLRFKGVRYRHEGDDASGFTVGPVDFAVKRGEITFIIGGNGSGKSTLGKMLSLHYRPEEGDIFFGNTRVCDETLESLRQEVAAIYSDYYLFDRLLGEIQPETIEKANSYLRALGLAQKVSIDGGKFSTLKLSDGQKRRVALLVAFLEDKNLYIFDEWAADQDPDFKDAFYRQVLPDLKKRGKCVIVISHDDRYFGVADHTLVMENGRLITNQPTGQLSTYRASPAAAS
jgi:putative ATP-binding cassette transporter